MVELGDEPCLAQEPFGAGAGEMRGEQFDRDRAIEDRVVGAIDHAHAALAELGVDAVAV
jgi:hypothetical protein